MKKTIRLTESELTTLIKRIVSETEMEESLFRSNRREKEPIKRFFKHAKDKISNFIHPKCDECGEELKDYGRGALNRDPLYVCDNPECNKSIH
jgi:hypothetical protein